MDKERIEITLLHEPEISIEDNSFGICVYIDEVETNPTDLTKEQMLHIAGILLKATRTFINNAKDK